MGPESVSNGGASKRNLATGPTAYNTRLEQLWLNSVSVRLPRLTRYEQSLERHDEK